MKFYKDGDIVIDDIGRELIITSGNQKYDTDKVYDIQVNQHYVRAREVATEPTSILDLVDGLPDFIWCESRIRGLK